jgi:hypothetical protein
MNPEQFLILVTHLLLPKKFQQQKIIINITQIIVERSTIHIVKTMLKAVKVYILLLIVKLSKV